MKRFLLISLLFAFCGNVHAQEALPTLDSGAFVNVITCGPGNDFYTTFGHSAIRICDTALGIDVVYNYGTFDFNTNHFYLKFVQGRLDYCLSRENYNGFIFEYGYEGRFVTEQTLKLTQQEKQNLFVLLETNYLPEYRYYLYDMFRDNCATRIRDIINSALGHRVLFEDQTPNNAKSYRQLLYEHTGNTLQWWQLGIDLVVGSRCDRPCTNFGYTFAPMELMRQLDTTCIKGTNEPLAMPAHHTLLETRTQTPRSVSPTLTFWALFVIILSLTVISWKKQWKLKWLDVILFVTTFLIAIAIIFLWFFSDHYCTKANFNLLWASPLFIYFAIKLRKSNCWVIVAQLALFAIVGVIALCGVQQFNAAVLPIILTLFIRLINLQYQKKINNNNEQ